MSSGRPILLMDIDGVIGLLGSGDGEPTTDLVVAGFPVIMASAAPGRLLRLLESFHMVWCTAWQQDAAEEFGPAVGLPADLPFLRFDPDSYSGSDSYKLPVVERFVKDRPVAWVDDELGEETVQWAVCRDHPSLIIQCDPRYGLTDAHVDELLEFARSIRQGA